MQLDNETDYGEPFPQSDVVFMVEGKPIYAVKSILCMWSTVMDCMMFSFNLPKAQERMLITLPNKKHSDFVKLMQVLNPPYKPIDDSNVAAILPLVDEYQIKPMVISCEKFLLQRPPSVHYLILAQKYHCSELEAYCLEGLKQHPLQDILQDPEYSSISLSSQRDLVKNATARIVLNEHLARCMEHVVATMDRLTQDGVISNDKNLICPSDALPHHEAGTSASCQECKNYTLTSLQESVMEAKQYMATD